MAFPDDPLGARTELLINDRWVDVSGDVYLRDGIQHQRGRTNADGGMDPATGAFTLKSPGGKYSNRDPRSPYYGLLGRNTRARVRLPGDTTYLAVPGGFDRAATPDVSALDITGSIDIRVDVALDTWVPAVTTELAGKYVQTGNQRSWTLAIGTVGHMLLRWSPDGTTIIEVGSLPVPVTDGHRIALRATMNAANRVCTFYTAPTLAGPWTQLGATSASGAATAVYASTAPLDVGDISGQGFAPPAGAIYGFELRNGIAGTVVAAPDFTAQPLGTTSFVDGVGRPWTLSTSAKIGNLNTVQRFGLEISEFSPRWAPGEHDTNMPLVGAGILQRLSTGTKAIASTLARKIPRSPDVLAYWPLEEGAGATRAYSPIAGVRPMTLTNVNWAQASDLASSSPLPVLASSAGNLPMMSGSVPAPTGATTGWQVRWLYKLDTGPATIYTVMRIRATGTVTDWYVQQSVTTARVIGRDKDGTDVVNQDIAIGADLYGQWNAQFFRLTQSGGTVSWSVGWQDIGGDAGSYFDTYTGTAGVVTGVGGPPDGYAPALDGMALGHVTVFSTSTTTAFTGAITGYDHESALSRLVRLAGEEPRLMLRTVDGDATLNSESLGPQRPLTMIELLQECEAVDGGILYEDRARPGLIYRDRTSLYNQTPKLTLDYSLGQAMPPMTPSDDLKSVVNDETVTRDGGSSARVVQGDGPLGTQAPEDGGIGLYDQATTLNLWSDTQAEQIAAWLVHLGTVDAPRLASVRILVHRHPDLRAGVEAIDIGDIVRIINVPRWVAEDGVIDLRVEGYSEDIRVRTWEVTLNTSPGSPWRVAVVGVDKADTAGSALATAVDATATSLSVAVAAGPRWVDSATFPSDFPIDIRIGGEVMTVTAITGTGSPQTFTVTRSVNGISKSHPVGAPVALAHPATVAL